MKDGESDGRVPLIVRTWRGSTSVAVERFTLGEGTTGLSGEAYYVGWVVVGHILEGEMTFEEIARTPAEELPALVEATIRQMIR